METIEETPVEQRQVVTGPAVTGEGVVERERREVMPPRTGAQIGFARVATALAFVATGALAIGALSVGALAIRRLFVRALDIKEGRFGRIAVDELDIGKLLVHERPRALGRMVRAGFAERGHGIAERGAEVAGRTRRIARRTARRVGRRRGFWEKLAA